MIPTAAATPTSFPRGLGRPDPCRRSEPTLGAFAEVSLGAARTEGAGDLPVRAAFPGERDRHLAQFFGEL